MTDRGPGSHLGPTLLESFPSQHLLNIHARPARPTLGQAAPSPILMSQNEALDWLADLFAEPAGSLQPETPRSAVVTWDSLGVLTLMAGLDEKFDLVVNDGDMRAMQTIGDVIEMLRKNGKIT